MAKSLPSRTVARELAMLTLAQFYMVEDVAQVPLEQLLEQAVRVLSSEAAERLKAAAAAIEVADDQLAAAQDAARLEPRTLPTRTAQEVMEALEKGLAEAAKGVNLASEALEIPLVRLLADQTEVRQFALHHVRLYLDHTKEINALIDQASKNWKVERIALVDANVLRMALVEMLYEAAVPLEVAIDEAIELAKKYGSEESPKFVNGVLGGLVPLVRERRPTA